MVMAASSDAISKKPFFNSSETFITNCQPNPRPPPPATGAYAHLVFGLQRYQLAHSPKRKRESEHFLFGDVEGQLAEVEDPGRDALRTL